MRKCAEIRPVVTEDEGTNNELLHGCFTATVDNEAACVVCYLSFCIAQSFFHCMCRCHWLNIELCSTLLQQTDILVSFLQENIKMSFILLLHNRQMYAFRLRFYSCMMVQQLFGA